MTYSRLNAKITTKDYTFSWANFASWNYGWYCDVSIASDMALYGTPISFAIVFSTANRAMYAYMIEGSKIRVFIDDNHKDSSGVNATVRVTYIEQ